MRPGTEGVAVCGSGGAVDEDVCSVWSVGVGWSIGSGVTGANESLLPDNGPAVAAVPGGNGRESVACREDGAVAGAVVGGVVAVVVGGSVAGGDAGGLGAGGVVAGGITGCCVGGSEDGGCAASGDDGGSVGVGVLLAGSYVNRAVPVRG